MDIVDIHGIFMDTMVVPMQGVEHDGGGRHAVVNEDVNVGPIEPFGVLAQSRLEKVRED